MGTQKSPYDMLGEQLHYSNPVKHGSGNARSVALTRHDQVLVILSRQTRVLNRLSIKMGIFRDLYWLLVLTVVEM